MNRPTSVFTRSGAWFVSAALLFSFPSVVAALNIPYIYKSAGTAARVEPTRLYHAPLGSVGATTADTAAYAAGQTTIHNVDCQGRPQPYKYLSFGVVSRTSQPVRFRFSIDEASVSALSVIRVGVQGVFRDVLPSTTIDAGQVTLQPSQETFFAVRFEFADSSKVTRIALSGLTLDNGAGQDPQSVFFTPGPPNLSSPTSDPDYYARIGDAYIGGVARLPGMQGFYRTDLTLLNTTANGMRVYLTFADRSGEVATRSIDLLPFRATSYPNVVETLFNINHDAGGYIVVHGYAPPDANSIYSSRDDIFARTYIDNGAKGTEGVALVTRSAFDQYFCASATTAAYQLVATAIASGSYHTNLALYPVMGETGVARVRLFDTDGSPLGETVQQVNGFIQINLYAVLGIRGERRSDYVVVDAPFFLAGYVSVIDDASGNAVSHALGRGWSKK